MVADSGFSKSINFVGANTFSIAAGITPVAVNCGTGFC
jgi:hypothetical protein